MQPVSLIALKVGDRRDFKPTVLRRRISFKIDTDARRKAHVAATKQKQVIGQFKFLKQPLYMVEHFVPRRIRMLGLINADNLDFVKLMKTVQAADIFAIATSLATKACRIGATFDGKVFLVEYFIAKNVSHGDLRRWN